VSLDRLFDLLAPAGEAGAQPLSACERRLVVQHALQLAAKGELQLRERKSGAAARRATRLPRTRKAAAAQTLSLTHPPAAEPAAARRVLLLRISSCGADAAPMPHLRPFIARSPALL
jgi:hypothetical protein